MPSFFQKNGTILFLLKAFGAAFCRPRDAALARRLRTTGLRIGASARIDGLTYMRIGRNFSAGKLLWLDAITTYAGEEFSPQLTIGDDCNFSDSVHIGCTNRVTLGSGVLCGSRVIITDHAHGIYSGNDATHTQSPPGLRPTLRPLSRTGSVVIGNNVWIGDGVAVLDGANIGDGCIIGTNSVVTRVLPSNTICAGAPARPLRRWDDHAQAWLPIDIGLDQKS